MSSARTALAHVVHHFEHHAEIASTNDRGMELARDTSISLPALVVAEKQTAGRGRSSPNCRAQFRASAGRWSR
jgi:hypothetical protein